MKTARRAVRGSVVQFIDDPWIVGPDNCLKYYEDAIIAIDEGKIVAVGAAKDVLATGIIGESTWVDHYKDSLILPGFIDSHTHFPQVDVAAAYGEKLLDWLVNYTFPAEIKLQDELYASKIARLFLAECIRNGTTSVVAFSTSYPHSADIFFQEAKKINMRVTSGTVFMDSFVPEKLARSAAQAYDDAKRLIEKWHNKGRAQYSIIDRFALTSSREEMEIVGQLKKEHPDCFFHTHLSENIDECKRVLELFPEHKDYLSIYEHYDLCQSNSIFAHGIHLSDSELNRLADRKSIIAHSPSSNTFLGSGLFDICRVRKHNVKVNFATDFGAGNNLSMLKTMDNAYKIAQLNNFSLHPAYALHACTAGAAKNLGWDKLVGNIEVGLEADLVVLENYPTTLMAWRIAQCKSIYDLLFVHMIMGDDRSTKAVYINGRVIYSSRSIQLI